jgi:sugar (pentulose or hexulose) kinase
LAWTEVLKDRATIVLDVGKTVSKLTLFDRSGGVIEKRNRSNSLTQYGGRSVLDHAGIEAWLAETLKEFAGIALVTAIIPVAHGAAAAIIRDGKLVCPPSDYESPIPADWRDKYDRLRDPFSETGSPALPDGLNLGAQLSLLAKDSPEALGPGSQILLWPQYWSWILSGVAASEVTSLGCHTDLWNPSTGKPSRLAVSNGLARRLPPLRKARDVLGPITPAWAARTGLPADTKIHCGLHDSNAALVAACGFPELAGAESTVLSTGTWFIGMRTTDEPVEISALPEARDCLINVDVAGKMVPSARWMGGREIELLAGQGVPRIDLPSDQPALISAIADVVASDAMLLPCFAPGVGPFPQKNGQWINRPEDRLARSAAIGLYAALMTDTALDLIGGKNILLIEGRFAGSELFVRALAAMRPNDTLYTTNAGIDVSFGALRLIEPGLRPSASLTQVQPLEIDLTNYKAKWHHRIEQGRA